MVENRQILHIGGGKRKNPIIEILRYVFMLTIVFWHSDVNPFTCGYLCVEFFFILSGWLLYKSFLKHKDAPLNFTINKLKRIYPAYVIALLLNIACMPLYVNVESINDAMSIISRILSELFLLNATGLMYGGINGIGWYISVLIIGGGLIYALIYYTKNAWKLIFTIFIYVAFCYFCNEVESFSSFSTNGYISHPLFRGIAEMMLGVVIAHIAPYLKQFISSNVVVSKFIFILSFCLFCSTLFVSGYDILAVISSTIMIIIAFSLEDRLLSKVPSICNKLGECTLIMLLFHMFLLRILDHTILFLSIELHNCIYVLIVIPYITIVSILLHRYIGNYRL